MRDDIQSHVGEETQTTKLEATITTVDLAGSMSCTPDSPFHRCDIVRRGIVVVYPVRVRRSLWFFSDLVVEI